MPYSPPHYSSPSFPPTGNQEVDDALSQWQAQFSQQHQETQEAASRLPFVVSTFTNSTNTLAGAPSAYLSKRVSLLGGEQVVVSGSFDFFVSARSNAGSTASDAGDTAVGTLRITYPSGSTQRLQARAARLSAEVHMAAVADSSVKSTVNIGATVGFSWAVEARFQNGGEHTFTLVTSGSGEVKGGTMDVLVL